MKNKKLKDCITDCGVDRGNPPTADLVTRRRGDIVDEGCLTSMNELEWRRRIGVRGCSSRKYIASLVFNATWRAEISRKVVDIEMKFLVL